MIHIFNMQRSHREWVCACSVASVMSDSLWPYGLQPTRLLCSWDSPGKNTGVGCHFLLQGDLPDPGMEPVSLTSPALAGWFYGTSGKNPASQCRRLRETLVQSLSQQDPPGGGNGNPLQYSCLENPMDREAWQLQRVRHDWSDLVCTDIT